MIYTKQCDHPAFQTVASLFISVQQCIYHKEYKTINSTKMLESIIDVFASQNYSLSKLYLFLLKLSNQNNYFGIKLQTIYYQSEIALKEENIKESIRLGHKIITWINWGI